MFFEKLVKAQDIIEDVSNIAASAFVATMMILTTIDVVLRYVFNSPLPGVYTLCEMLMVGAVYLGISYVQREKGHIRVDVLIQEIRGIPKYIMEISVLLLALISFSIMAWKSTEYAWEAWVSGNYTIGIIEYPLWPAKTFMAFGVILLCFRFLNDICLYIHDLRKHSNNWIIYLIMAATPLISLSIFLAYATAGLNWERMTIGWILLIVMIILLVIGLPVSFALLTLGITGYWILAGPEKTFAITGIIPYDKIADYSLSVVPVFILMGNLVFEAGFANSMYKTAQKWIGHIPGSLAQATVLGGAAFGAACGSGLASVATLAKVCIPAMEAAGIQKRLAVATVGASATLAQMIPPSVLMVIYAIITDQSVAKLLIAGILPGMLAAGNYIIMIYIRCKINPNLAPHILKGITWRERFISLKDSFGILTIAFIVIGGIYTGIFTPTEAGALGASSTLILSYINKRLKGGRFKIALMNSTKTTAMIFLIIGTTMVFGYFLGISRIPANLSEFLSGLDVPRIFILLGILLMYIVAGCFVNMLAFAFLTLPIIFPTIVSLNYDPIWFGVLTVHLFEIAAITPPFGMNLFVLRAMVPEMKMADIIRGVIWFTLMDLITLSLYIIFPQIATWLPSKM